MSENRRPIPRKVENLDDLFLLNVPADEGTGVNKKTSTLKISQLIPFENHPFRLYEGDRLNDMVESIKEIGVILPVIVRPKMDGLYEILSGHNRVNASKLAGLTEVPIIIKEDLTDDEALLIVTETNLIQRSFTDLLHSERAKSLAEHHKALASQGKRTDLLNEIEKLANAHEIEQDKTFSPMAKKLRTHENIGQKYNLSKDTIARYLRINKLIRYFKDMLDADYISIRAAYGLSFLDEKAQTIVENVAKEHSLKIDMKAAETLRTYYDNGKLDEDITLQILSGVLNKKVKMPPPFKLKNKVFSKYFSHTQKSAEVEDIIDKALTEYFENHPEDRKSDLNEEG